MLNPIYQIRYRRRYDRRTSKIGPESLACLRLVGDDLPVRIALENQVSRAGQRTPIYDTRVIDHPDPFSLDRV